MGWQQATHWLLLQIPIWAVCVAILDSRCWLSRQMEIEHIRLLTGSLPKLPSRILRRTSRYHWLIESRQTSCQTRTTEPPGRSSEDANYGSDCDHRCWFAGGCIWSNASAERDKSASRSPANGKLLVSQAGWCSADGGNKCVFDDSLQREGTERTALRRDAWRTWPANNPCHRQRRSQSRD